MTTSWYVGLPNICLEGGIYVVAKRLRAHEMTSFFFFGLQTEVFTKRPPFFYSPHQMTPYFSFVLTERPHIYSVTERPLLLGSCPHIPVTSICDSPRALMWRKGPFTNTCKGAWCKYLSQKIFGAPLQTANKFQGPPLFCHENYGSTP